MNLTPVSHNTPAHDDIAPSEQALRTLLEAPADLPLVQWRFIVSDDRWLDGCYLQMVGTLVPVTVDRPDFLFILRRLPQPTLLQAWLWRVSKPRPPPPYLQPRPLDWNRPFGDLRWHPQQGRWNTMELRPSDGPDVARRVWGWLHALHLASSGRPPGSGARFDDAAQFRQTVITDLRNLRENKRPDTQLELARLWYEGNPDPTAEVDSLRVEISNYCRTFGLPWKTLQTESRRR